MANMQISKNNFNRFNIENIVDVGIKKDGKTVEGVAGYHGPLANIIGWILEKIFHKTVAVSGKDGTYYLNCQSLVHFLNRFDSKEYANVKDLASKAHDPIWVEQTIQKVIKANQKKEELQKQFLQAIEEGNVSKCKELIEEGASAKKSKFGSPLHKAVQKEFPHTEKHLDICQLLIAHGADINARDEQGRPPLEIAVKAKNMEIVLLLIAKNADISLKPSDRKHFSDYVDLFEDENEIKSFKELFTPETQKTLIESLRNVEEKKKISEAKEKEREQYQNFRQTVLGGHLNEFKKLLEEGYKPDIDLLITAVSTPHGNLQDRLQICELIVANGVSVNDRDKIDQDKPGTLPVEKAIRELNPEMLKWLIDKGADLTLKPSYYEGVETLFEMAKKRLLYNQGEIGERRAQIFTLLGHADFIEQEKIEENFGTVLSSENLEDIKKFIDKSFDVTKPLANGEAPLRRVTFNAKIRFEICKHILAKGAKNNINEKQRGELPLEWAIYQNDPILVKLFIDNGANINLKGSEDRTLLQIAEKRKERKSYFDNLDVEWDTKHAEVIKLLTPNP